MITSDSMTWPSVFASSGARASGPWIRKRLESIELELIDASGEPESARRWLAIAEALAQGDYAMAITHLIDQNREVMAMRGGAAPWVEIRDGKLDVKICRGSRQLADEGRTSLALDPFLLSRLAPHGHERARGIGDGGHSSRGSLRTV